MVSKTIATSLVHGTLTAHVAALTAFIQFVTMVTTFSKPTSRLSSWRRGRMTTAVKGILTSPRLWQHLEEIVARASMHVCCTPSERVLSAVHGESGAREIGRQHYHIRIQKQQILRQPHLTPHCNAILTHASEELSETQVVFISTIKRTVGKKELWVYR